MSASTILQSGRLSTYQPTHPAGCSCAGAGPSLPVHRFHGLDCRQLAVERVNSLLSMYGPMGTDELNTLADELHAAAKQLRAKLAGRPDE
jgi:hypothetical protein